MCGRFILATPAETLGRLFGFAPPQPSWDPTRTSRSRFNVAPTQPVLVVLAGPFGARPGAWARWGMRAAQERLAINARSETAFVRPAFRTAMRSGRVVVLADGFFEWKKEGSLRRPHHIRPADGRPLALAGLAALGDVGGVRRWTCAILTTRANPEVAALHDRMPVVLEGEGIDLWLDPSVEARPALEPLLGPARPGFFVVAEVSSRVNKVDNDDPECLATSAAPPSRPRQLGFDF